MDFTNLNKACPKDSFPVPRIGKIPMFHRDEEHTTFITDRGLYCYKVMPFGLKNVGATYPRLVNKIFAELLGVPMEVYINDMLAKSVAA